MVDKASTILSVLARHQEGKAAIAKAKTIRLLIDLLQTRQPCNKENAAAILLAICKNNVKNLACIGRLGALNSLAELANSGTDRAKRKAASLLDDLPHAYKSLPKIFLWWVRFTCLSFMVNDACFQESMDINIVLIVKFYTENLGYGK
ncbi:putative armadillo-like helical protein [Dioscorea sansibarensis]